MKQHNKYRPHHMYINNWFYFITARCVDGNLIWVGNEHKDIFCSVLRKSIELFKVQVFAWVLLGNHYHLLMRFGRGRDVSKFIKNLHVNSARLINKLDQDPGRQVWYQYWDYCIRNRTDFWKHFNYIIQNPLKHGLVKNLREAYMYAYSSNPIWLNRFKEDGLSEGFTKYSVKDWTPGEGCE